MMQPIPHPAGNDVVVRAGSIVVQRLFDIAYATDLARLEVLCMSAAGSGGSRARLAATPDKAVTFGNPPLLLPLPGLQLELDGETLDCAVRANFYDFGALAIAIDVPVRARPWAALVALSRAADRALGPAATQAPWAELCEQVVQRALPALTRPARERLQEDYLLIVVREFDTPLSTRELLARIDPVPLLSGEDRELSESARAEVLRQQYSYYADDLVLLTWDRAFIVEPRGESDVADVLEVANAQLLELRYYDELLDAELPQMYDEVEKARHARGLLAARHFAHLARRLHTQVAEVTELTEKIDNALQVTEDVYLARVYSAALTLFRVPTVAAAVDRKLAIVRDTYTALYEEASARRAELLEVAIVVLILIEIVLGLLKW